MNYDNAFFRRLMEAMRVRRGKQPSLPIPDAYFQDGGLPATDLEGCRQVAEFSLVVKEHLEEISVRHSMRRTIEKVPKEESQSDRLDGIEKRSDDLLKALKGNSDSIDSWLVTRLCYTGAMVNEDSLHPYELNSLISLLDRLHRTAASIRTGGVGGLTREYGLGLPGADQWLIAEALPKLYERLSGRSFGKGRTGPGVRFVIEAARYYDVNTVADNIMRAKQRMGDKQRKRKEEPGA